MKMTFFKIRLSIDEFFLIKNDVNRRKKIS